jgi:hypothetical protein
VIDAATWMTAFQHLQTQYKLGTCKFSLSWWWLPKKQCEFLTVWNSTETNIKLCSTQSVYDDVNTTWTGVETENQLTQVYPCVFSPQLLRSRDRSLLTQEYRVRRKYVTHSWATMKPSINLSDVMCIKLFSDYQNATSTYELAATFDSQCAGYKIRKRCIVVVEVAVKKKKIFASFFKI